MNAACAESQAASPVRTSASVARPACRLRCTVPKSCSAEALAESAAWYMEDSRHVQPEEISLSGVKALNRLMQDQFK